MATEPYDVLRMKRTISVLFSARKDREILKWENLTRKSRTCRANNCERDCSRNLAEVERYWISDVSGIEIWKCRIMPLFLLYRKNEIDSENCRLWIPFLSGGCRFKYKFLLWRLFGYTVKFVCVLFQYSATQGLTIISWDRIVNHRVRCNLYTILFSSLSYESTDYRRKHDIPLSGEGSTAAD